MYISDSISQKALELGINPVDINIHFKTNGSGKYFAVPFFDSDQEKIKELNEFILSLRYEKEIKEMKPQIKLAINQVDL
nr:MAG: hypothetical protein B6I27_02650 [Erwiniaceae bacterium 4572_131]